MHDRNPTALITGASGGIGYALAKLFAKDHYNLVLVARTEAKLIEFAAELQKQLGVTVKIIAMDLADPQSPQRLFNQLENDKIAIDILVNNAGYGLVGPFAEVPLGESLGQVDLNIRALTEMTRLFVAPMVARKKGKVLNVASTAAFQAGPLMAVYFATKAYVLSFSEALANELRHNGITVTCLCPGPTETGFKNRAGGENSRLFKVLSPMTSQQVALVGYRGLIKGKPLVIPGLRNWIVAESSRFAPRRMATAVSGWIVADSD